MLTSSRMRQVKIHSYLSGSPSIFSDNIQYDDHKTLDETIRREKCLYDQHRGISTLQKAWEDKKKKIWSKRKKGTKPPFFRNNSLEQPTSKDPRMREKMGKILRRKPIKCLGCEGENMYRCFPHRGEKVRIVHNVQQNDTLEDMGR
jgi:hypothetical protein